MWVYAGILTAIGVLALSALFLPKRSYWLRQALMVTAVGILLVFMGFRDQIGADWPTYDVVFNIYSHLELRDVLVTPGIEPCYALLNYSAHLVGGDIHLVNLVCAALMLLGLVRFAYLVEVEPTLFLFLSTPYLLFAVGMGYTRQGVAIGIGFAALGYWIRDKPKKFYAAALLAIGFHYSAVLLLLFVWMKNWKRAVASAMAVSAFAYLLLSASVGHYFSLYIQNSQDLHSSGVWFRLGIILMGVAAAILQKRHWQSEANTRQLLVIGSAIAIVLVPVAILASTLADRICLYLFFIYLIGFGRAIRFSRPELRYVVTAAIFSFTYICFFLWFSVSTYAAEWWLPYHSSLFGHIGAY